MSPTFNFRRGVAVAEIGYTFFRICYCKCGANKEEEWENRKKTHGVPQGDTRVVCIICNLALEKSDKCISTLANKVNERTMRTWWSLYLDCTCQSSYLPNLNNLISNLIIMDILKDRM